MLYFVTPVLIKSSCTANIFTLNFSKIFFFLFRPTPQVIMMSMVLSISAEGQLISKWFFWGHRFPQKNERTIRHYYYDMYLRSTCFCSFFGGNRQPQKNISKLTDLYHHAACTSSFVLYNL